MPVLSIADLLDLMRRHGATAPLDAILVAGALTESEGNTDAQGDGGHSWGLFQMYDQGLGAGMSVAERCDPDRAVDVMLTEYERAYGNGQAYGLTGDDLAAHAYLYAERPWQYDIAGSAADQRFREKWQMVGNNMPSDAPETVTYNADAPRLAQPNPWSCSITTSAWCLQSIGMDTDEPTLQGLMVPDYVTPALGLLDGSGAGLALFIAHHWPVNAWHQAAVSWDWLLEHAGQFPIALGLHGLYHWVGVRRVGDDGALELANPAHGYGGLFETMTEAQFYQFGPASCVWILPAHDEDEEDTELSQAEKDELAQLRETKTYCDALVGSPTSIIPSALGTIEDAAKGGRGAKWDVVRAQCAAVREQAGL